MSISCTICLDPLFLLHYMSTFSYVGRPTCLSSLSSLHFMRRYHTYSTKPTYPPYFSHTSCLRLCFLYFAWAFFPLPIEPARLPYIPYTMWVFTPTPSYIRLQARNRRRLSETGRPSEPALNPGNDNQVGERPLNARRGSDQTDIGFYRD